MCQRNTQGTATAEDGGKFFLDEIERHLRETKVAIFDMKSGFECRSEVIDKLKYLAGMVGRMEEMLDPQQEEARRRYVAAGRELKAVEGEVEFDDDAKVSMGNGDGAYVQAWIWIDARDVYRSDEDGEV